VPVVTRDAMNASDEGGGGGREESCRGRGEGERRFALINDIPACDTPPHYYLMLQQLVTGQRMLHASDV